MREKAAEVCIINGQNLFEMIRMKCADIILDMKFKETNKDVKKVLNNPEFIINIKTALYNSWQAKKAD